MARNNLARILALIALLSSVYSAAFNGAWYCEGKQCGITLWHCCCDDADCDRGRRDVHPAGKVPGKVPGVASCPRGCECTMKEGAGANQAASDPSGWAVPPTDSIIAPASPGIHVPAPTVATALSWSETRGPPFLRSHRSTLSLRAPPTA